MEAIVIPGIHLSLLFMPLFVAIPIVLLTEKLFPKFFEKLIE